MKLKRDPSIFRNLIGKGYKIEIPESSSSLIFGNTESNFNIKVFLSYYCSACAKKFPEIKRLIDSKTRARIQLVLATSKDELSLKLTGIICSMHCSGNGVGIPVLLDNWYKTDPESKHKLLDNYKNEADPGLINEMMEHHTRLFQMGKIAHVPSVYINGYSLPDIYDLEEAKFFMEYFENPGNETKKGEA